jgi:hypothetical protein
MLDNSMILLGTSNSRTHNNRNYPLVLAGGANLGMKHGQFLTYNKGKQDQPMSNLLFTLLNRMGASDTEFSDSSSDLSELYA